MNLEKKKRRQYKVPKTPAQEAVKIYGMDLFATGSTQGLVRFFKTNGMPRAASMLEQMVLDARHLAKVKYEARRKEIDPSWIPEREKGEKKDG